MSPDLLFLLQEGQPIRASRQRLANFGFLQNHASRGECVGFGGAVGQRPGARTLSRGLTGARVENVFALRGHTRSAE